MSRYRVRCGPRVRTIATKGQVAQWIQYHATLYLDLVSDRRFAKRCRSRGVSVGAVIAMHVAQGEACAICRRGCADPRRLNLDHNHETGEFRGLLCGPCNSGLGALGDHPTNLSLATSYLQHRGHYGSKPGRLDHVSTPAPEFDEWARSVEARSRAGERVLASEHRRYHAWRRAKARAGGCLLCDEKGSRTA
mgnify:CR=1 FL=1